MLDAFDPHVFETFIQTVKVNSQHEIIFQLKCGLSLVEKLSKKTRVSRLFYRKVTHQHFNDPLKQAEYLYSIIKSEVDLIGQSTYHSGSSATRQQRSPTEPQSERLRVASYCRVSTELDEQANSYETQVSNYKELIQKDPSWDFAGIFADDGISGTNTKKRDQFNKMIKACKAGKIDLIVTKSISRFARNTIDCLKYIHDLKAINVAIFFEKENINTMDAKGEVLITHYGFPGPTRK